MTRLSRFHWFLLLSALLIGGVVITASVSVAGFFKRQQLVHLQTHTAAMVLRQAHRHLRPADFEIAGTPGRTEVFRNYLAELPGVVRIKVFDTGGRIVWADEPRLIGHAFPDNANLARALRGETVVLMEKPEQSEHVYERTWSFVAEAYVPVAFEGAPGLAGVIESYADVTDLMAQVGRLQMLIWVAGGGMGLVLYGGLALIVSRVSRIERRALRRLEEQHRQVSEAHERLAAILAGVADWMMIIDRDMRVTWMNPVAAEHAEAGASPGGPRCYDLLGGEAEECHGCPAVRAFASGRVERGVRTHRRADGQVRHLDLVAAPLRDGSGQVHQVLEVSRDITDLVEMEERLKQSNRELQETQAQLVEKERLAAIGQLVVGLHHAILNPLTGALGGLRVLRRPGISPEEQERLVAEVEQELHRIEQLVRRLPDLRSTADSPYVGRTTMIDLSGAGPGNRS